MGGHRVKQNRTHVSVLGLRSDERWTLFRVKHLLGRTYQPKLGRCRHF